MFTPSLLVDREQKHSDEGVKADIRLALALAFSSKPLKFPVEVHSKYKCEVDEVLEELNRGDKEVELYAIRINPETIYIFWQALLSPLLLSLPNRDKTQPH